MKEFTAAENAYIGRYCEMRWSKGEQSNGDGVAISFYDREELWKIATNNRLNSHQLRSLEEYVRLQMWKRIKDAKAVESERMKPLYDARKKCLVQPRFGGHKGWNDLNDDEWLEIVSVEPKFSELCDWITIKTDDCSLLAHAIAACPQYVDKVDYEYEDERELWLEILQLNPSLIDHCDLSIFYGCDWCRLLEKQPQLSGVCDWGKLDPGDWGRLLVAQPQFGDKCPWNDAASHISGSEWARLLAKNVNFADYCDWSKLEGHDWVVLLSARPELSKRCPWSDFSGRNWVDVIIADPRYAEKCVWTKLDGYDWVRLLKGCPQFASECAWDKLADKHWVELLSHSLNFAKYVDRRKAGQGWSGQQFLEIVDSQPEFIKYFPSINVDANHEDGRNWLAGVLVAKPELLDWKTVPWEKFSCRQWHSILLAHPEFVSKCNMDGMDAGFWFDILMNHAELMRTPDFSKRFSWTKFVKDLGKGSGREQLAELLIQHPEYADKCDWKEAFELDDSGINDKKRGVNIFANGASLQKKILNAHPRLAKYCCWDVVDAGTWARCYNWEELWAQHEKEIAEKKREAEERQRQEDARKKEEQERSEKVEAEKRAEEEKRRAEEDARKAKEREEADRLRAEEERKEHSAESRRRFGRFLLSLLPSAVAGYGVFLLYTGGDLFHSISLGAPLIVAMIMHWCGSVRYRSLYIMYAALIGAACGYGYQYHNWDYASVISCVGLCALIQNAIWHRRVFHSITLFLTGLTAGGLYLFGRWGIGTAVVISMCFVIGLLKEGKNTWTWWRWALYVLAIAGGIVTSFCNHEFWGVLIIICSGSAVMDKN